jgi:bifunctional non-homologous end joining protein LigD
MPLREYHARRSFDRTPEPRGRAARPARNGRAFVVQEHAARSLHHDFRLELDGALKSWAVPKGPSLVRGEKRLAVQVEDHPVEYARFAGTIPPGQYGAGRVTIWDRGTWEPEGDAREGLKHGHLRFRLDGSRLQGRWDLVRMGGKAGTGGKNWLLIRADDDGGAPPARLTHPDRVLYPGTGITKRALAGHYASAAVRMMPYVRERPLSLFRCPDGIGGTCFWARHAGASVPGGLRAVPIQERRKAAGYLVVERPSGLGALAQMGALEVHAWNARADRLETPDQLVFDVDPGPGVGWERVVETARWLRARLRRAGLTGFAKATGGKGLHVVVPLVPRAGWDEARGFSRQLVEELAAARPGRYTTQASKAARPGRIFLDYLRNARGATAIVPYSPRARAGAPVAVPLRWTELETLRAAGPITILDLPRRLSRERRDPWAGFERARRPLPAAPANRPGVRRKPRVHMGIRLKEVSLRRPAGARADGAPHRSRGGNRLSVTSLPDLRIRERSLVRPLLLRRPQSSSSEHARSRARLQDTDAPSRAEGHPTRDR